MLEWLIGFIPPVRHIALALLVGVGTGIFVRQPKAVYVAGALVLAVGLILGIILGALAGYSGMVIHGTAGKVVGYGTLGLPVFLMIIAYSAIMAPISMLGAVCMGVVRGRFAPVGSDAPGD